MNEQNLRIYVNNFFNELTLYDDKYNRHTYKDILKGSIDVFFDVPSKYNAYNVYEIFLNIYQITNEDKSLNDKERILSEPNIPLDLAKVMFKYENMKQMRRDTIIHSVNVFLLGLAIYAQNSNYRQIFTDYVRKTSYKKYFRDSEGNITNEEFLYRWGITSLFEDIAIPLELFSKSIRISLNEEINTLFNSQGETLTLDMLNLKNLDSIAKINPYFGDEYNKAYLETKFLDLFKPTDIIVHKLGLDFNLDLRQQDDIKKQIDEVFLIDPCKQYNIADHGVISSIIILNIYGYLIQKYEKNPDFFFYPIVDSAEAIFLQNYYRNILQRGFNLTQLLPEQNPLAFLLILCDELSLDGDSLFESVELNIDDKRISINVLIRKEILFNYSEDKKHFLNSVLDISSIFSHGLDFVTTIVVDDNLMKENSYGVKSTKLPIQIMDKLAKSIYEKQSVEKINKFNELPPLVRITYVRQAKSLPKKLSIIGCEMVLQNDSRECITEFSKEEINDLAIAEHDEWCEDKRVHGWTYGEIRDNEKLKTPYLVPWEMLTPQRQEYYINSVKNIPSIVESVGLKIVRTKERILILKMREFDIKTNKLEVDKLPEYVKYKQVLFKLLGEQYYKIVSINEKGEAINSFKEYDIYYFAKREHEEWYKIRISSGWIYGEERNDELKTSPRLVPWEDLSEIVKRFYMETIEILPRLCDEVGLKIIKN